MTTLREAAQQALEALEEYQAKGAPLISCAAAVAALRVALVAAAEREACIKILEAYQIPVGNSPAGELACDWTYDALKKIRDEIRERGVVIRERTYTDGENMVLSAVIAPSTP